MTDKRVCHLSGLLRHTSSASHDIWSAMLQRAALAVLHASMLPLRVFAAFTGAYDRGLACSALCCCMQVQCVWLSACLPSIAAWHGDTVPLTNVHCTLHLAPWLWVPEHELLAHALRHTLSLTLQAVV